MTSLHIKPVSSSNETVAIYVGDSKLYLDITGFKPAWTYLLKVKDSYRTVLAIPARILCKASVFNEALHLLTTHSVAQPMQEPARSAIFAGTPARRLIVVEPPTMFSSPSTSTPGPGYSSCHLSACEQRLFLQVGQNMSA